MEKLAWVTFLGNFPILLVQQLNMLLFSNQKYVLTGYFDFLLNLVPLFYFLKWNRFFSTFIPGLCESHHYFNDLLPWKVCTNLQIKRFPLMKFWYTIWMGVLISKVTILRITCLINIYYFWNCLSKNLLLTRLIIINFTFTKNLQKIPAKQLNFIPQHNPLVSANQNTTIMITPKQIVDIKNDLQK